MSGQEDTRLVDLLYGELESKEEADVRRDVAADPALAREYASLEGTLASMRTLEDEDPPAMLDAKILAYARQEADAQSAEDASFLGRLRRAIRSPLTGLAAASAVVVVIVTASSVMRSSSPNAEHAMPSVAREPQASAPANHGATSKNEVARTPALEAEAMKPAEEDLARDATAEPEATFGEERKRSKASRRAEAKESNAKEKVAQQPTPSQVERAGAGAGSAGALADSAAKSEPKTEPAKKRATREEALGDDADDESSAQAPASAANKMAKADDKAGKGGEDSMAIASAMIRAAEEQLKQKDREGARRILLRAIERTRGTDAIGPVALRLAELDFEDGRFEEAQKFAALAASAPVFAGSPRARQLQSVARQKMQAY